MFKRLRVCPRLSGLESSELACEAEVYPLPATRAASVPSLHVMLSPQATLSEGEGDGVVPQLVALIFAPSRWGRVCESVSECTVPSQVVRHDQHLYASQLQLVVAVSSSNIRERRRRHRLVSRIRTLRPRRGSLHALGGRMRQSS